MKNNSSAIVNDARVISELAQRHPANPDVFVQSLDVFFREMCREMATKQSRKEARYE